VAVSAGCGSGPLETTTRMCEPRLTEEPADGDCVSTRPAGWLESWYTTVAKSSCAFSRLRGGVAARPVPFGAFTVPPAVVVGDVVVGAGALPVETFSVTCEPLSTSLPAGGFCATTLPGGSEGGALGRGVLNPAGGG